MRKKFFYVTMLIATIACYSVCLSSCSSEDEMSNYEYTNSVAVKKAKVLDLAYKYGLDVTIDDLAFESNAASLNMDSVEAEFKAFAKIKGVYKNLPVKGNRLTLNTNKEKQLKKLKSFATTREVTEQSGSYFEYGSKAGISVYFNIAWTYKRDGLSSVKVVENSFEIYSSKYYHETECKDMEYQFVGPAVCFTYSFKAFCKNTIYGYQLTLSIKGDYKDGVSSCTIS